MRRAALLAYVPNCKLCQEKSVPSSFIINCVFNCICQHPAPQALKPASQPSAWSHQSFASIMIFCIKSVLFIPSIWSISAVYQTSCHCSVGFFNRSDKSSDTAFRYQGQTNNTSECSTSNVHRPALAVLPGEIGFRSTSHLPIKQLR